MLAGGQPPEPSLHLVLRHNVGAGTSLAEDLGEGLALDLLQIVHAQPWVVAGRGVKRPKNKPDTPAMHAWRNC